MSVRVMSAVFDGRLAAEVVSSRDLLVLLVLADHAHDDGSRAWPSINTIAVKARMTRRTVSTALRSLEAVGAIEREGKKLGGVVCYRVLLLEEGDSSQASSARADSAYEGGGAGCANDDTQVGEKRPRGRQPFAYNPSGTVQEPSNPAGDGGHEAELGGGSGGLVSVRRQKAHEAHGILADLAADRGLQPPTLAEVVELAERFPDHDHVGEALATAREAPRDLKSVLGFHRHRLQANPRPSGDWVRYDREAFLAAETANREARAKREAAYAAHDAAMAAAAGEVSA